MGKQEPAEHAGYYLASFDISPIDTTNTIIQTATIRNKSDDGWAPNVCRLFCIGRDGDSYRHVSSLASNNKFVSQDPHDFSSIGISSRQVLQLNLTI